MRDLAADLGLQDLSAHEDTWAALQALAHAEVQLTRVRAAERDALAALETALAAGPAGLKKEARAQRLIEDLVADGGQAVRLRDLAPPSTVALRQLEAISRHRTAAELAHSRALANLDRQISATETDRKQEREEPP